MIFPLTTKAKVVNDVSCEYNITCEEVYNFQKFDTGYFRIEYRDYNDGNYPTGKKKPDHISIQFFQDSSMTNPVDVAVGGKIKDYPNKDKFKQNMLMLYGDPKGENFGYLYKQKGDCPTFYCAVSDNLYISTTSGLASGGVYTSDTELKPIKSLLRNSEENEWKTKDEFYKDNSGKSTAKEPLVCSYDLDPQGEYYDTGLNQTVKGEKANVVLTTNYDPNTGNVMSYDVTVNGSSTIGGFTSLDEEVRVTFRGKQSSQDYTLYVEPDQLKILFAGNCLDASKLYLYLHKDELIAGSYGYHLTTNKEEMEENLLNEDDDKDTHVPKAGDSDDDGDDIDPNPMSCEDILGPVLTAIVKYAITIIQIAAAIIAIVKGMLILIPAVVAKDASALQKAGKTLVILGIILAIIIVLRPVIRLIGTVLEYDVSCII